MPRRHAGKFAQIYLGGVLIAEMRDASLEVTPEFAESRGWGKNWTTRDPIGGDWKISATKFNITTNIGQFLQLAALTPQATSPATAIVYDRAGGARLIEGPVWAGPATMALEDSSHSTETIDFVAADEPTYVAGSVPTP